MEQIARTPQQLGAVVRRVRKASGMTQAQLGEKISLRQATISKLEDGAPATQLRTLIAALAALDLELVVRPRTRSSGREIEELF
jgi:HTH-type transcriptional regulator / antitoxin HipB